MDIDKAKYEEVLKKIDYEFKEELNLGMYDDIYQDFYKDTDWEDRGYVTYILVKKDTKLIPNFITDLKRLYKGMFNEIDIGERLTIPALVNRVDGGVLFGCSTVKYIGVHSYNKNFKSIDGNLYEADGSTLIQYATGKVDKELIIPSNVIILEDYAFAGCKYLERLNIPESVGNIRNHVFTGSNSLKEVVIADRDKELRCGDYTFADCAALERVYMGENVMFNPDTFLNCKLLKSVVIPHSMSDLQKGMFEGCSSLAEIYYKGTAAEWSKVKIYEHNDPVYTAKIYFYAEKGSAVASGNYWYYDKDGKIVTWQEK